MQDKNHLNENFSSRLRDLMEEKGIKNPTELANISDVGWTTAKQWMEGTTPRKRSLDYLASSLEVNTTWLLTGEGEKIPHTLERTKSVLKQKAKLAQLEANVKPLSETLKEIPVLSWAHAGQAMAYEQMPEDYLEPMAISASLLNGYKAFGLLVDGDSMEPVIEHGDQIAVMQDCQPRNGCFVVAKFIHDSGVMVRRYQVLSAPNGKPEKVKLIPYNSFYDATEHHISEFEWIMPVAAMARKMW